MISKHLSQTRRFIQVLQGFFVNQSVLMSLLVVGNLLGGCLGTEVGNGLKPPRKKDESKQPNPANGMANGDADRDAEDPEQEQSGSLRPLLSPLELIEVMTNSCANPLATVSFRDTSLVPVDESTDLEVLLEASDDSWTITFPSAPRMVGHVKFLTDDVVESKVTIDGEPDPVFDTKCGEVSVTSSDGGLTDSSVRLELASKTVQLLWTIQESSGTRSLTKLELQSETGQSLIKLSAD
jgi:hypothetical protein